MAFVTKTWKDRLVEYAGRRKLKNVATGEEILMDVSRSEGTVNQAGDAFSAANMNNLEQRIKTEFDSVNSSLADLGGFKPVINETTGEITGYKTTIGGADTVFPFKGNISAVIRNALSMINTATQQINITKDKVYVITTGGLLNTTVVPNATDLSAYFNVIIPQTYSRIQFNSTNQYGFCRIFVGKALSTTAFSYNVGGDSRSIVYVIEI